MAEESARVAQRCQEAKDTRQLVLDGCDLRKFPDAIFFLVKDVDLQTTSLANNQLKKIPAKLGLKFTTVTSLDLSNNQLSTLPDTLTNLQQLTELNLSGNQFETFPEVLKTLPSLKHLDLSSNKVSGVSPDDLQSPGLESVDLRNNSLTEDEKVALKAMDRIKVTVES